MEQRLQAAQQEEQQRQEKRRHRKKKNKQTRNRENQKKEMILSIKIPTREQVELIRRQYPVGTRIILNHMDDSQAPPPGTKAPLPMWTISGRIGVKWDTGSSLSPDSRRGFLF